MIPLLAIALVTVAMAGMYGYPALFRQAEERQRLREQEEAKRKARMREVYGSSQVGDTPRSHNKPGYKLPECKSPAPNYDVKTSETSMSDLSGIPWDEIEMLYVRIKRRGENDSEE